MSPWDLSGAPRDDSRSSPPILHPLPDIAVHVEQSPRTGPFSSYRIGVRFTTLLGIASLPGILIQEGFILSKRPPRRSANSAGIFPLDLGGKAVVIAGVSLGQLLDKILHVVPIEMYRWTIAAFLDVRLPRPGSIPHHHLPLALGDLVLARIEPLGKGHQVQVRSLPGNRPHGCSRWDPDERHRGTIGQDRSDFALGCFHTVTGPVACP